MKWCGWICSLLIAGVLGCLPAAAQVLPSIVGRVTDASGGSVASAHIVLTQTATGVKTAADTEGYGDYSFSNLTPGLYQVEASAPGYSHLVRNGITAIMGTTVTVDLELKIGSESNTVLVTGDAPLLQSATSNIETNISSPTIASMPLNTRNFIQLATQSPGVELPPGTLLPRINGGRPRTNEYLVDGISLLQPEPGQRRF